MKSVYAQDSAPVAPAGTSAAPGAPGASAPAPGLDLGMLLPLMIIWFVFMIWWSNQGRKKKEKQQKDLIDGLKKKDEVVTIGGIIGKIDSILDDCVVLRIDNDTTMKIARNAISKVVKPGEGKEVEKND